MKKLRILTYGLVVLLSAAAFTGQLNAQLEEQAVEFQTPGGDYLVSVRLTDTGSDVFLDGPGMQNNNLACDFPGENLFPTVTVHEASRRFMVAWMHYRKNNVRLCLYDSRTNTSRAIELEQFKSACPLSVIFYDDDPLLLLFKGNNSGNTDVFYYHLASGRVENITRTADSEQFVQVFDEENRLFIETGTLYQHSRYRLKKRNLKVRLTAQAAIEYDRERKRPVNVEEIPALNTIVGFGDSITWGRMNMNDLDGDYHPELAYLAQLQEIFAVDYGAVDTINKGVPGDTTLMAAQRLDDEFSLIDAFFCLVMLGTNDVIFSTFDVDASIENLYYILTTAREFYHMHPVISTIPPQRRHHPTLQYFKENTEALNQRIIQLAQENGVPFIDTYKAFMEHPGGWVSLLEDIKGNHPNPEGHHVIANLFKEKILDVPPAEPGEIVRSSRGDSSVTFGWSDNREFDFSHYAIQFGYLPDNLNRGVNTLYNFYTFINLPLDDPFNRKFYFRVQAVDKDGNTSDFTPLYEAEFRPRTARGPF
jgi:lysophospholipase L1-like esterase